MLDLLRKKEEVLDLLGETNHILELL